MLTLAEVGRPDPVMLRRLATLLDDQLVLDSTLNGLRQNIDTLIKDVDRSQFNLGVLWKRHHAIMLELEQVAAELLESMEAADHMQTISSELIIDNVIVNIDVQFEFYTRNGNPVRTINAISIKRNGQRVDVVSQNSNTLIVMEDREWLMDIAIKTISGATIEDTLRLVMVSIERWTLEHRFDNHYDLVINLLLKCKVIVHPEVKDVTPVVVPEPQETPKPVVTRAPHSRTYIPHGTTFWREGHYRTRNGVRYWVDGHYVTR